METQLYFNVFFDFLDTQKYIILIPVERCILGAMEKFGKGRSKIITDDKLSMNTKKLIKRRECLKPRR